MKKATTSTSLEEERQQWNQQMRRWVEQQLDDSRLAHLVTPVKSLESCRAEWIEATLQKLDFDHWGAIPLRALLLIEREVARVLPSEREARELWSELAVAAEQLDRPFTCNERPLQEQLSISSRTMGRLYALAVLLLQEERIAPFGDLILFLAYLNPEVACYRVGCGLFYAKQGEFQEALSYYREARELAPGDPYSYLYGAQCWLKLGDKEMAREWLEQLLHLPLTAAQKAAFDGEASSLLAQL